MLNNVEYPMISPFVSHSMPILIVKAHITSIRRISCEFSTKLSLQQCLEPKLGAASWKKNDVYMYYYIVSEMIV